MAAILPVVMNMTFEADPDVPYYIRVEEVMVLMPIFRWRDCGVPGDPDFNWIDATGDYDLCMTADFKRWQFISRRPVRELFSYRYVSTFLPQSAWRGLHPG